jgi:branched-chain amino acid transport system substrate-binding protein
MMKSICTLIATTAVLFGGGANAQYTDGAIKIGVLTDMSGLYSDTSGAGSVVAAKMAVQDFDATTKGMKVEIVSADHQNKADLGSTIARSWFDVNKVDVIVAGGSSAVALAVSEVTKQKNKVLLVSDGATSDLTGPKCNANTIHWVFDTWNLANGTGKAMVKTGGDTWFFITADYAFGQALERDTAAVVEANGGKVLGRVRHPINNNDFFVFPSASPIVSGEGNRLGQCGRRHDQFHQAGRRIRHHRGRPSSRGPARVRKRRRRAWFADRARARPDRDLVLGHER